VKVALVHDYLTQRGGAERVVLSMLRAFPGAPLYTSLYEPEGTFPEFGAADVRTLALNRIAIFRRRHRLALPLLAPSFGRLKIDADVVLCSSSGWAHGARTTGAKIVYCYTPARWLYQTEAYLGSGTHVVRPILAALRPYLARWDRRAATSADCYVTSSTAVRDRIRFLYGIDAQVVPPPPALDPSGPSRAPDEWIDPGFFLCISRLLPYKNVRAVVDAFRSLEHERLIVVGTGPEEARLRQGAPVNVRLLGGVTDDELRWLYANTRGVVAASFEDYGLTPLEAAMFGKPSAVLRWGGFLDTVEEGCTGLFFHRPEPVAISEAVERVGAADWDADAIAAHARRYSEDRFIAKLRQLVATQDRHT
jgi:glycosyltransferase involved in cell wall biosynthesis